MKVFAKPFPLLTVVVVVVLSALPWGGGNELRIFLPMLPLAMVHFWSARCPHLMPATGVFSVGLFLDLLTQSPLGYYALLALTIGLVTSQLFDRRVFHSQFGRLIIALFMFVGTSACAWILASLYVYSMQPITPYVTAFLILAASYPFVVILLNALDKLLWSRPERSMFSDQG
jgi:rod shape-determining protein MreD